MSDPLTPGRTRYRIDFVIKEVSDDPSASSDDLKFVRFGDEVEAVQIRDFFDRCGQAAALLFRAGEQAVYIRDFPAARKIDLIKTVRELTNCGLKVAKDLVEGPPERRLIAVLGHPSYVRVVEALRAVGCTVDSGRVHLDGRDDVLVAGRE